MHPTFSVSDSRAATRARTGVLTLPHGAVRTPVFMPVGTVGSVKSLSAQDIQDTGAQIILGNTYHLYLRPGCEVIHVFGGLHRFMGWPRPILTDSGGFQVFSLAGLTRITDEGARFQSHIDGSTHLLTPEKAVEIQLCLNSDVIMCLDQCIAYPADPLATRDALARTTRWAARCRETWQAHRDRGNALFGIVQGGMDIDLRRQSVEEIVALDFSGHAIGGLSVGEPTEMMYEIADRTLSHLPQDKPRYIMGVGTPQDLVELVDLGADMFDCVMPTRNARNGQLFTRRGPINISNARFKTDAGPVEEGCDCHTCAHYSRAYLRHLYLSRELLAYRLNTLHNIRFYIRLMETLREAIAADRFQAFKKQFYQDLAEGA